MMRRLLALAAVLIVAASPAFAYTKDVALVSPDWSYFTAGATAVQVQRAAVRAMLTRWGVTYDEFTNPPTNWCRTGIFGASPAMSGTQVTSYRAVIHVGFDQGIATFGGGLTYDPRDLFQTGAIPGRGDSLPTVPQLMIAWPTSAPGIDNQAADSMGITNSWSSSSVTYAGSAMTTGPHRDFGISAYVAGRTDLIWHVGSCYLPVVLDGGTFKGQKAPVKFRMLIGAGSTASADTVCHENCDSLTAGFLTLPDTGFVWQLDYSPLNGGGKASITMCAGGVSPTVLNEWAIAHGIAAVDSQALRFTGARITHQQQPIAFHIDDGGRRSADPGNTGGLYAPDSTAWKGSLSLFAAAGIPVTLGWQLATLYLYDNQDSIWVRLAGNYWRVTPHVHTGLVAYTLEPTEKVFGRSDPASAPGMLDLFRVARVGITLRSCSTCGKDTTLGGLQAAALAELQKRYPGHVDRLAMPPTDDWTPTTMLRVNMGPGLDSLAIVMKAAGYLGIRTNLSCLACIGDLQQTSGNMANAGFSSNPMAIEIRDPTTGYITGRFQIVTTDGYANTGSSMWTAGQNQFTTNVKSYFTGINGAGPTVTSVNNPYQPANLFASHVNDFAGNAANYTGADTWGATKAGSTQPKRPGWWAFKWTAMWARSLKAIDGVELAPIVWPEELTRKVVTW